MSDEKKVHLYADKIGQRKYTLASLREKIQDQFNEETLGRTDILQELDTREKRIQAMTEAADYVLATEYVNLPAAEKRQLIEQAVANLFYFGLLDAYLKDEQITEITLEGVMEAHIRRGFEDMTPVEPPFENITHLEQMISRMIAPAGAVLMSTEPFLEIGLEFYGRLARLSLIAPPISVLYSIQVRLHPKQKLTLDSFVPTMMSENARERLIEIVKSGQGILVTGEVGVGKTTLLAALLDIIDAPQIVVVERAKEMQLADTITRLAIVPPKPTEAGKTFEAQIREAMLHHAPHVLVLDEIRGDEHGALWDALKHEDIQQKLVAFRGTSDPARLLSALTIAIRKGYPTLEASEINEVLQQKLPYVVALQRPKKNLPPRLSMVGQWVQDGNSLRLETLL